MRGRFHFFSGVSAGRRGGEKALYFKAAQNEKISKFKLFKTAREFSVPINNKSIVGHVAVTGKYVNIKDAYSIEKDVPYKFNPAFDKQIGYRTGSVLALPIADSNEEVIGVLQLINRRDKRAMESSEEASCLSMPFLAHDRDAAAWVTGLAGVSIENIRMMTELKDQNVKLDQMVKERTLELNTTLEELERDLNTARKMQLDIVPQTERMESLSRSYLLEISSIFKPCKQLGGDFWDIIELGEEKIGIIVMDFAGHGIAPSLNTFRVKEFIYSLEDEIKTPPSVLMGKMNKNILHNSSMYATCFYSVYDKREKKLSYCRAGHPYGLWYKKSEDKVIELNSKGMALGVSPESKYEDLEISLEIGDKVFFYTDGIIEVEGKDNEFFCLDHLKSTILRYKGESSSAISRAIMKSLEHFTGGVEFEDDITLIAVERT